MKRRAGKVTDKERLDWYNRNGTQAVAHYTHLNGYRRPSMWLCFDGTMNAGKPFNTVRQAIDYAMREERRAAIKARKAQ